MYGAICSRQPSFGNYADAKHEKRAYQPFGSCADNYSAHAGSRAPAHKLPNEVAQIRILYSADNERAQHYTKVQSRESEIRRPETAYFNDLKKIQDLCEAQTGVKPTLVRFPGGTANGVSKKYCAGIMTKLTKSLPAKGYFYCDWNVDSEDAVGATTADEVFNNVIEGIQKRETSYVLQHDIFKVSVEAVEDIIRWGLENGYTFLPLTEESPMLHHKPNN